MDKSQWMVPLKRKGQRPMLAGIHIINRSHQMAQLEQEELLELGTPRRLGRGGSATRGPRWILRTSTITIISLATLLVRRRRGVRAGCFQLQDL